MWLIQHRCTPETLPQNYGMLKGQDQHHRPITALRCDACGEQLVVDGWEMFDEAEPAAESNLPAGFVIAKSVKQ